MSLSASRRLASLALWITLLVEAGYLGVAHFSHHTPWDRLEQPIVFLALFAGLAILSGGLPWYPALLRVFYAYEFGSAVADRFGWLGPPGSGVAWGNFAHFVAYTHLVNAFLPGSFAYPLAVLATIGECTFTVTLLLGIRTRWAFAGAAVLLFLFASAMTASGLVRGQFDYAVFVLAAGAWYLSTVDPTRLSLDRLLARRSSAQAQPTATSR